jgi:deoxyribonucleoside regulator
MGYDKDLIVKVAKLHYLDKISQEKIAENLKISRYQVSRMLLKASEQGIVNITITEPVTTLARLEDKLEKNFNLQRAIVITNNDSSDADLKSKLGSAAAKLLVDTIKDGDVIGVSWGNTINETVCHLPSEINRDVEIVQIAGGFHKESLNISCHDVARRLALRFNKEPHLLYSPAILKSEKLYKLLIEEYEIKEVFDLFDKVTMAIIGIGAISDVLKLYLEFGSISHQDEIEIKKNKAVGNVLHLIDSSGNYEGFELNKRSVMMSPKKLLKVPYVIGIAGGLPKIDAISGALKGELINILITDDTVAKALLMK